ncbi:DUF6542 domain-containing protein, partial [Corynebacterium sphenisci]|uniref:DUF6542 domain-containing protein n=1 Tax=Corynebacterium sphenisci TaxID=191493 RepID=UPI0027089853|nr:hypothetical protein [Corynebacterium sphenisci]
MSATNAAPAPPPPAQAGPRRLPLWAPAALLLLAAAAGVAVSTPSGSLGWPYLVLFLLAALAGVGWVDPRGLVVAVSQIPVLFSLLTPVTAWFTASFADPAVGGALASTPRKTRLITAVYPVVQFFPWMLAMLVLCTAVGIWRYLRIRTENNLIARAERKRARERRRAREDSREAARARRRIAEHGAAAGDGRPGPARASEAVAEADRRRQPRAGRRPDPAAGS